MLKSPYCKKHTWPPNAEELKTIRFGRFTCEHCGKDFVVIDNEVLIESPTAVGLSNPSSEQNCTAKTNQLAA
jgi:hypothetical protein